MSSTKTQWLTQNKCGGCDKPYSKDLKRCPSCNRPLQKRPRHTRVKRNVERLREIAEESDRKESELIYVSDGVYI